MHAGLLALACLHLTLPTGPPPDDDPIEIPDVYVDGHQAADDAAPSTVIDRSQTREALPTLPTILDQQPGLRVTRVGGLGSFSSVSIRGSTGEQVRVVLDGIPLDSADGGQVNLGAIPFGPVQTVTIYRGVSPILFGGSAIGGVIALETRQTGTRQLELEAGGGSFGTRVARGFYGDGGDGWSIGLSVDYQGSTGDFSYRDDRGTLLDTSDDRDVERENNHHDQFSVLGKGTASLGGGWSLRALNLFSWRSGGLPGRGTVQTREANLDTLRNVAGLSLSGDRLGSFRFETELSTWLGYTETRYRDPLGEIGLRNEDTADTALAPGVSLRLRKLVALDDALEWTLRPTAVVDYRYEAFTPDDRSSGSRAALPSDRHVVSTAAEVSFLMGPIDTELVASGRYERVWSTLNDPGSSQGLVRDPTDSDGDDEWTWRAALVQRSIPFTELRFNASTAVRFPNLFELFGNTGAVLGNPRLLPETGLTLDGGIVHSADWLPRGNRWTLQVHAFWTRMDDLIALVQNSQGTARAENIDSAELMGLEIGTFGDVLRHLRFRGAMTWMLTENTGEVRARKGKALPRRPEWQVYGRLDGYHDFDTVSVGEVGLWFDAEHLTGNFLDSANLVAIPERTVLGAGAYATFWNEQLRVDVTVRNLTGSTVQDLAGYPLPGLTAMATLRYTPTLH